MELSVSSRSRADDDKYGSLNCSLDFLAAIARRTTLVPFDDALCAGRWRAITISVCIASSFLQLCSHREKVSFHGARYPSENFSNILTLFTPPREGIARALQERHRERNTLQESSSRFFPRVSTHAASEAAMMLRTIAALESLPRGKLHSLAVFDLPPLRSRGGDTSLAGCHVSR